MRKLYLLLIVNLLLVPLNGNAQKIISATLNHATNPP